LTDLVLCVYQFDVEGDVILSWIAEHLSVTCSKGYGCFSTTIPTGLQVGLEERNMLANVFKRFRVLYEYHDTEGDS
jgi:hypothetical protein